jgi:hypothetical protein
MRNSGAGSRERQFFRGVPSFFAFCCAEASLGKHGYSDPGWHLTIHLTELIEPHGDDGPAGKLEELTKHLEANDDRAAWAFLWREFPACMELVPDAQMKQFLSGFYHAYEQERLC